MGQRHGAETWGRDMKQRHRAEVWGRDMWQWHGAEAWDRDERSCGMGQRHGMHTSP